MIAENQKIINKFLKFKKKSSTKSANSFKYPLTKCIEYIEKIDKKENRKPKLIKEIKRKHIYDYFEEELDSKNISINTKQTYRLLLKAFFNYIEEHLTDEEIDNYKNPVPKFPFTVNKKTLKKKSEEEDKTFTISELLEILEKSKKKSYRDFILFGILISTGMRIDEALTIRIENIQFERSKSNYRSIDTGFEDGAMKSSTEDVGICFLVPENFLSYIKQRVLMLNKKEGWLFPGRSKYMTQGGLRRIINIRYGKVIRIDEKEDKKTGEIKKVPVYYSKYSKFHKFRTTLITNYIDNSCPDTISEILMNHKPSTTQKKRYIKPNVSKRRNYYDKYFPYNDFYYF